MFETGSTISYVGDLDLDSLKLRFLTYKMVITTPISLKTYVNHAMMNGSYY